MTPEWAEREAICWLNTHGLLRSNDKAANQRILDSLTTMIACWRTFDYSSEAGIRARSEAFRERRERIASQQMQGLVANPAFEGDTSGWLAERAVDLADALMARLDRDPEAGA